MAFFFQLLQRDGELGKQTLIGSFIFTLGSGQLAKGQYIKLRGITHTRIAPVFIIKQRASPTLCTRKVDIKRHAQQIIGTGVNHQYRFT